MEPTDERALIGFMNNMTVIIMEKIWSVLPDMYIMMAFIGIAFAGASAISHAFLRNRSSVSLGFAGVLGPCFADFWGRAVSCLDDTSPLSLYLCLQCSSILWG